MQLLFGIFLPLISWLTVWLFRPTYRTALWIIISTHVVILVCFFYPFYTFITVSYIESVSDYFVYPNSVMFKKYFFETAWGFEFRSLNGSALVVATLVSMIIQLFWLRDIRRKGLDLHFLGILNIGLFSFFIMATAINLMQFYWGLLGFSICLYMLITRGTKGYFAHLAAKRSRLLHRISDVAFFIGIVLAKGTFNTIEFIKLEQAVRHYVYSLSPNTVAELAQQLSHNPGFVYMVVAFLVALCTKCGAIGPFLWLPPEKDEVTLVSAILHYGAFITVGVMFLCQVTRAYLPMDVVHFYVILMSISSITWLNLIIAAHYYEVEDMLLLCWPATYLSYLVLDWALSIYSIIFFYFLICVLFQSIVYVAIWAVEFIEWVVQILIDFFGPYLDPEDFLFLYVVVFVIATIVSYWRYKKDLEKVSVEEEEFREGDKVHWGWFVFYSLWNFALFVVLNYPPTPI